jgi:hypothetical protein
VDYSRLFMDPLDTRVYLNTRRRDLQVVDPGTSFTVPVNCGPFIVDGGWDLTAMSRDRRRAFVRCPIRPYSGVTYAIDLASGARVATIEDASGWQATNDEGTELFTLDRGLFPGRGRVRRIDVETATILAEVQVGTLDSNLIDITVDTSFSQVLVFGENELYALDSSTLEQTARVVGPIPHSVVNVALDPDLPHVYVTWSRGESNSQGFRTIAQQRVRPSLALLAEGQLPSSGLPAGMVIAPRVTAPIAVAAVVTGRSVRLSWTPSQDGRLRTGFLVEAGSAPGLANLAAFRQPAGADGMVVDDVPSGTYYVRVRTVNGTGPGVAGAEIVVNVP